MLTLPGAARAASRAAAGGTPNSCRQAAGKLPGFGLETRRSLLEAMALGSPPVRSPTSVSRQNGARSPVDGISREPADGLDRLDQRHDDGHVADVPAGTSSASEANRVLANAEKALAAVPAGCQPVGCQSRRHSPLAGSPARPAGRWGARGGGRMAGMGEVIRIDDPADPRVGDYVGLTDTVLRTRAEPAGG